MGIANEKPLCVNSSTNTSRRAGPASTAPIMAAAPTRANAPIGVPGHMWIQSAPKQAPKSAPVARNGVKTPPAAPLPSIIAVTIGFKAKRANSSPTPPTPEERFVRHVLAVAEELRDTRSR
jgi:hypothetical protein